MTARSRPSESGPAEPADPRVVRSRGAILSAAIELLIEGGPSAVTVDAVVAESGVAKTTIYRHWASRDDLLYDVFLEICPTPFEPDLSAGFVEALRSWLRDKAEIGRDERWKRALPALTMLKDYDERCRTIHEELTATFEATIRGVLDQGIGEGLVHPDTTIDQILPFLLGPLTYRSQRDGPLDDELVEEIVTRCLAAEAARLASRSDV